MAQYRELAAFAQFGTSELDKSTRAQIDRGRRITEILKQPQYEPMPVEKQVMILYAATNGFIDDVPTEKVIDFEKRFQQFMEAQYPAIGETISKTKVLDEATEEKLKIAINEFKKTF
jgi:F-type H+-transporting ATPase subunit alpha